MRHAEVRVKDVMLPFVILFVANFIVLLTWTLVSPLQWTRVKVDNFDRFGRVVETYGTCFGPSKSSSRTAFLVTLGVFNFIAVALANYECYQSRHAPSDFNESYYISLSMLSILESFLLGIPILFLTIGKPTAQYVVSSVIIFLLCMSILITTFGSKLFVKKESSRLRTSEWRRAWRNYDETASRRRTITAQRERPRHEISLIRDAQSQALTCIFHLSPLYVPEWPNRLDKKRLLRRVLYKNANDD